MAPEADAAAAAAAAVIIWHHLTEIEENGICLILGDFNAISPATARGSEQRERAAREAEIQSRVRRL